VAADLTRRAVSAAVSVARAHGVEVRTPCVLSDRSNVMVRLAPAPLRRAALLAAAASLVVAGCGGGDDRPSHEEARRCLEGLDLHVMGAERQPDDRDAPDEELIANDVRHGRVMVFAGYYDDEARASRLEPSIRRNARRFDGSVERHGTVTLLWVRGREGRLGERTRDCLL
jgi:hypothetical protein